MKKTKVKEWLNRYVPSEIAGITTAYLGFWFAASSYDLTAAAFAAALAENFGFYGVILFREIRGGRKHARAQGSVYGLREIKHTISNLMIEFGPSELADSLFIRPLAMGGATHILGAELGILTGKLLADVTFFIPTIALYEFNKRRSALS